MDLNWNPKSNGSWALDDEEFFGTVFRVGKHYEFSVSHKKNRHQSYSASDRSVDSALQRATQAIERWRRENQYGPKTDAAETP